jgi:hypothetical protein
MFIRVRSDPDPGIFLESDPDPDSMFIVKKIHHQLITISLRWNEHLEFCLQKAVVRLPPASAWILIVF